MVLCRNCAHYTSVFMLRCPRCGWALPWYRSRRWKPWLDLPRFAAGKDCPHCGRRTTRRRTPLWVRPLRTLSLHRCSYRTCDTCGWHGAAFHGRGDNRPAPTG